MADLGGALGERWSSEWAASAVRRANAAHKLRIYNEAHLALVEAAIAKRHKEPGTVAYVQRFASRAPNLTLAVATAVAVAYNRGCGRELVGVPEQTAKAFASLVFESGITRKAGGWNARAWLAPVLVSPHLDRRNRLALDFIGGDAYTARLDGDFVEAALWRQDDTYVEISADAWRYYDLNGNPISELTVFHACGRAPGVHTTAIDNTGDPWIANAHDGLIDATLDVGALCAWHRYTRAMAGVPMTVIMAEADTLKAAAGQPVSHPGKPFSLPAHPGEADVKVLDRTVSAAEGLAEISAAINMAMSAEGIPPGTVSLGHIGNGGLVVAVDDDRLALLRDKQVPWLSAGERELWPIACDLVRGSSHSLARLLPSGDEVRDALRLSYPDLASPKLQQERIAALRAGLPFGLSSATEELMAARPELSRAEAEDIRRGRLAEYIADIDPLVHRNVPADAPEAHGAQTIAQEQGRAGGEASGQTRAAQAQENAS